MLLSTCVGRIPDWSAHPIAVRHPFCFYYGHIASFAKIKMLPEVPMVSLSGHGTLPARWPLIASPSWQYFVAGHVL